MRHGAKRAWLCALWGVIACGGDAAGGTPCNEDVLVACVCDDGQIGHQRCEAGALGACECPDPLPPGQCRSDLDCSDGVFCNGVERCRPSETSADVAGCTAPDAVPDCDDGVECTSDACAVSVDRCVNEGPDADQDGHVDVACLNAEGDALGDDCDDADADRFPGNPEICDEEAFGHDEDCDDTTIGQRDRDGDGAQDDRCCNGTTCGTDCDDTTIAKRVGQPEFCDNADNDCDGDVDEETAAVPWYVDADGDGFGAIDRDDDVIDSCNALPTRSLLATDCNDTQASRHPAQLEVCDLRDNNCNGIADEDARCPYEPFPVELLPDAGVEVPIDGGVSCGMFAYPDLDGDGFGNEDGAVMLTGGSTDCAVPANHVTVAGDCDDDNALVNPGLGRTDVCNLIDDDCDGVIDQEPEASESCALPNTVRSCDTGTCVLATTNACTAPFADCDQIASNGCETNTTTSARHCGGCGMACGLKDLCSNSTCQDTPILNVVLGDLTSYARRAGGVIGWGESGSYELGIGGQSATPLGVTNFVGVTQLAAGVDHACVRVGGAVYCWGNQGPEGRLGNGMTTASATPQRVHNVDDAIDLATGNTFTCVVRADRTVWCWGDDGFGQLGDGGGLVDSLVPVQVVGITDAIQVTAGSNFACALHAQGSISCWGQDDVGRLGWSGAAGDQVAPVPVQGIANAVRLASAQGTNSHMCAITEGGGAVCWGYNNYGTLSDGGNTPSSATPSGVVGVSDIVEIAIGYHNSCFRNQSGEVYCAGYGSYGGIGNGGANSTNFGPLRVSLGQGEAATSIAVGGAHACAVLASGGVVCWGHYGNGRLGSSTNNYALVPTPVVGLP